jgi:hypothetical protein
MPPFLIDGFPETASDLDSAIMLFGERAENILYNVIVKDWAGD